MRNNIKDLLDSNIELTQKILNNEVIKKIGELKITSGKLIVGDFGYNISLNNELVQIFPVGNFPIFSFNYGTFGTTVIFNQTELPVLWRLAKFNSKIKTKANKFRVETGTFGYTDSDGLNAIKTNESNKLYQNDFWNDELCSRYILNKGVTFFDIPIANSPNNLITSVTGWGDGQFTSYIGYDKNGDIVCLYSDVD